MTEFVAFPKIPRLNRDMVITEKIDGTNACVVIEEPEHEHGTTISVAAQSRKRLITPEDDNFGFARWVADNAESLVRDLGLGRHYGEWWGSGIQRGYGLPKGEKRFSLFNTTRWVEAYFETPGLRTVPVLFEGLFDTQYARVVLADLVVNGSVAAPGFNRPEGIIVYHTASNHLYKATIENDEGHKG